MTDKHTPGPWKAVPHGSRIYGPDGYELAATSYEWQRTSTTEANARLIAAAPDMLAALLTCIDMLQDCLQHSDNDTADMIDTVLQSAQSAIDKATQA